MLLILSVGLGLVGAGYLISKNREVQVVYQFCKLLFLQYLNETVKKIGSNTFEITYSIRGRIFKTIVRPSRGPCPVLMIYDERGNVLTDVVRPYLGPNYNISLVTPKFFKCKTLIFQMSDGEEITLSN